MATSDGLEQIIIRGEGCRLMSARELQEEIKREKLQFQAAYMKAPSGKAYLGEFLDKSDLEKT